MGVRRKERHLTCRIATVGAVCVGFDKLPDGESVRSFAGGDRCVLYHEWISLFDSFRLGKNYHSRMARGSRNASIPYMPNSRPTPECLNPPHGACGSSCIPLIAMRPARSWEATRRARSRLLPLTKAWRPYRDSFAILIASSSVS